MRIVDAFNLQILTDMDLNSPRRVEMPVPERPGHDTRCVRSASPVKGDFPDKEGLQRERGRSL